MTITLHKSIRYSVLTLFCMGYGCSETTSPQKPYRARIVAFSPEGYKLQTVEYKTVENIDNLANSIAVILGNAALNGNAEITEIIDPRNKESIYIDRGRSVKLDYQVREGVIYPRNFDTMALLSLFYHYETTLLYWVENMNLPVDEFGRLRIYYAPRIKATSRDGTLEGTVKVNAAFLPGPRDLFFFKTSAVEEIPINMNLGVIAHEFAHAVFDYRFADKDASLYLEGSDDSQDQLRGINEGIADFFSYLVTQRPEDLGESLAVLKSERTIPVGWTYSSIITSDCEGGPYCKGSILASALYEISRSPKITANEVATVVYDALPLFRETWKATADSINFNYHHLIRHIIDLAPHESRDVYCDRFQHWFDVSIVADNIGC